MHISKRPVRASLAGSLVFFVATACGGESVLGGEVMGSAWVPRGVSARELMATGCVDAAGKAAREHPGTISVVQERGRSVLFESRPGYSSLLVRNSFWDGGDQVFQAIIDADNEWLYEFRVPVAEDAVGRLSVASAWKTARLEQGGFRARYAAAVLSCRLEPRAE
jgi:hypothetical protein